MKGAIAEPVVSTIKTPKSRRIKIMGKSQNFFLSFKNPHKSFKNSIYSPITLKRFIDVFFTIHMIAFNHYR